MNDQYLEFVLNREIDKYSKLSYGELLALDDNISYYSEYAGGEYQIEINILEKENDYVHISVAVDDGSLSRSFAPLCSSFLVYKNGRVDK